MYQDKDKLEQYKQVWLTKEADDLISTEKIRLRKKENRRISKAKLVNNLIIEKYGDS